MKATEHPTQTPLALLNILDDLDTEIVLAGALLAAIGGLECSGLEYDGTYALSLLHITRLREIHANLAKFRQCDDELDIVRAKAEPRMEADAGEDDARRKPAGGSVRRPMWDSGLPRRTHG